MVLPIPPWVHPGGISTAQSLVVLSCPVEVDLELAGPVRATDPALIVPCEDPIVAVGADPVAWPGRVGDLLGAGGVPMWFCNLLLPEPPPPR